MYSKTIVASLLLVACVAGVALSAPVDKSDNSDDLLQNMMSLFDFGDITCGATCDLCKKVVERLQESGAVERFRERFDVLCMQLGDQEKIKQCQKKIDDFAAIFEKKNPTEVCQTFKFCPPAQ